jgi:uncharacterized membrane protein SpoIIM required for sporulation
MKQEAFEREREPRWTEFVDILSALDANEPTSSDFARAYRIVCMDLALARDRGFSTSLVDRLNDLAIRGHQRLYGVPSSRRAPVELLVRDFPAAVRARWRTVLVAALLFYGCGGVLFALEMRDPDLIYYVLDAGDVANYEAMYDPARDRARTTQDDFAMFAYYVSNNIGIGLRAFAYGAFAGVGSMLLIAFNGVTMGVVAAHMTNIGNGEPFFSFVIGHASFELTAILLAGVAGLELGWSLIAPGSRSRLAALRANAKAVTPILYGMIVMLLIAAVVEAFWSSAASIPTSVKYAVGAGLWAFVAAWLGLGGRSHARG